MFSICADPPPMPSESVRSVGSICGHDLISRSSTIAKCCGAPRRLPRCHSRLVMSWKRSSPSPVNAMRHDRLAELVEVVARAVGLDVAAGHLGNRVLRVVRLVAEEVVVRPARRQVAVGTPAPRSGAQETTRRRSRRRAPCRLGGRAGALSVKSSSRVFAGPSSNGRSCRRGSRPKRSRAPSRPCRRGGRTGVTWRPPPAAPIDGPDEVLLEVEELELCGLPDQLGGLLGIRDACQLDDDLVRRPACASRARRRRACRCGSA